MPCRHFQPMELTAEQVTFIRDCAFFVEQAIMGDGLKGFMTDVFLRFFSTWRVPNWPYNVSVSKLSEKMRVSISPRVLSLS